MKRSLTETERRVRKHSLQLRRLQKALARLQKAQDELQAQKGSIQDLKDYMASGQWLKDYEADERREIGHDVPRDVLSQDALYNTLQDLDSSI